MTVELAYASVRELAALMASRKLSPVELLDHQIQRIEARNPSLNAFVFTDFVQARQRAQQLEAEIMAGRYRGALHGIPMALKDLFSFKPGWPMTYGGLVPFRDHIAAHYGLFAKRMEDAGANLISSTNSPVLGFRGTCDNPLFGPTRNPFHLQKNSGGSSGGSAAAVADGLLPLAQGTDAGGSIRIPAAWCGVYGFKPSYGRVPSLSRPNGFRAGSLFYHDGVITRTVEDAAIALHHLTGGDDRDPFALQEQLDYLAALDQPLRGMRIAYSPNLDVYPVAPEVATVVAQAVGVFAQAGAHVEIVTLGLAHTHQVYSDLWCRLASLSTLDFLTGLAAGGLDLRQDHPEALPREVMCWLNVVEEQRAMDLLHDQHLRTTVYDALQNVFRTYDLLLTPTVACLPVDNGADGNTLGPAMVAGEAVNPLIGWCLTYLTNFSGHPSASVPAGLSAEQLPVGLQIIGKQFGDLDVIKASAAFERLQPWQGHYAICQNRSLDDPNAVPTT